MRFQSPEILRVLSTGEPIGLESIRKHYYTLRRALLASPSAPADSYLTAAIELLLNLRFQGEFPRCIFLASEINSALKNRLLSPGNEGSQVILLETFAHCGLWYLPDYVNLILWKNVTRDALKKSINMAEELDNHLLKGLLTVTTAMYKFEEAERRPEKTIIAAVDRAASLVGKHIFMPPYAPVEWNHVVMRATRRLQLND
ncbi:MAG TPA: hypothetical protein VFF74_10505 [Methylophilaceae bacterium]|nr:hypothetical protein [Methylophilaceae bacterium]